jgi:transposase
MTTKVRKQYTEQFTREAVNPVTAKGYRVSEAARNLGAHVTLLRRWKEQLEAEGKGERPSADEREELRRLRAENRQLRMEWKMLRNKSLGQEGARAARTPIGAEALSPSLRN